MVEIRPKTNVVFRNRDTYRAPNFRSHLYVSPGLPEDTKVSPVVVNSALSSTSARGSPRKVPWKVSQLLLGELCAILALGLLARVLCSIIVKATRGWPEVHTRCGTLSDRTTSQVGGGCAGRPKAQMMVVYNVRSNLERWVLGCAGCAKPRNRATYFRGYGTKKSEFLLCFFIETNGLVYIEIFCLGVVSLLCV